MRRTLARVHGGARRPARRAARGRRSAAPGRRRRRPSSPASRAGSTRRAARTPSLRGLRGRVVLVDFWTYTCINCLRTLPHLRAWDARYRDAGPDDRRRPHARVRVRAPRVQRARRDREQRAALPGRARQRLRHVERVVEPVLAGEVPDRRARAGALLALRRGRLRRDRGRDPRAARRGRAARRAPPAPAVAGRAGRARASRRRRPTSAWSAPRASPTTPDPARRAGLRRPARRARRPTGSRSADAGRIEARARRGRRAAPASTRTSARAACSSCSARRDGRARVRVLLDGRPLPDRLAGRRRARRRRARGRAAALPAGRLRPVERRRIDAASSIPAWRATRSRSGSARRLGVVRQLRH